MVLMRGPIDKAPEDAETASSHRRLGDFVVVPHRYDTPYSAYVPASKVRVPSK